jgi:hypothetical protein
MVRNWIAGSVKKPGALHAALGVPQGKNIPSSTLNTAFTKAKKIGNAKMLKRITLARTFAKMK